MMMILASSGWTTFLDCVGLMKTSWLLPHTHYGWATLQHIFTSPLPPQWTASFKYDIFVLIHLNLHTAILMTITTWRHPSWVVWDLPFDASPMKAHLTPHTGVSQRPWVSTQTRNGQCLPYHGITWSLSVHLVRFVCWSSWFTLCLRSWSTMCLYDHSLDNTLNTILVII